MRRILLLGYFGAGNLGDDCLLADFLLAHASVLRELQLRADIVSSGRPPLAGFSEEQELQDLLGDCIDKRDLLRRDLRRYAALVLPGGSVLQDSSSLKSLLFYLEVIRRAAAGAVPVCLLHQGIGPLQSWLGRLLTPRWLRRSRLLSLRDLQSFEWVQTRVGRLQDGQEAVLSADPILAGRLTAPLELLPEQLRPGGYLLCIPRPTGDLPYPGDSSSEPAALARLLLHGAQQSELPIVLAAFHPAADSDFVSRLADECGGQARIYAAPPQARGRESTALLSLVRNAGLLVGYRLHSLVLAASAAVPGLGVAYDPKVSAFCAELGYPCCYPAEVHGHDTLDRLSGLWSGREARSAECEQHRQLALLRLRAAEDALQGLLRKTAG